MTLGIVLTRNKTIKDCTYTWTHWVFWSDFMTLQQPLVVKTNTRQGKLLQALANPEIKIDFLNKCFWSHYAWSIQILLEQCNNFFIMNMCTVTAALTRCPHALCIVKYCIVYCLLLYMCIYPILTCYPHCHAVEIAPPVYLCNDNKVIWFLSLFCWCNQGKYNL